MTQPRTVARFVVALPLVLVLGFVATAATSLVGWSLDVDASALDRVRADGWLLAASGGAGAAAGASLVWALTDRTGVPLVGALLGLAPAVVKTTAFFTHAY